jgi:hypothetical protein
MSIVYKCLILVNRFFKSISFKLISFLKPTSLFIIFISYILLFISLINKGNLLVKVGSISDIISPSVKLSKRVV